MPGKIQDWSFWYALDKIYVRFSHRRFYKEISVKGLENIPVDMPVIFAPNHQNALMDALAILCVTPFQPVFMARADIFNNKLIARILSFLKIMPVYRIRDGYSNLEKNDEIIEKALDVLRNKKPLCLMPEGNHGEQRKLRPLVKGIFRIAFKAQENYGLNTGVKIIPVGLDYTNYEKFKSFLIVNFGKPIEIADYYELYQSNQAVAYNALRERLIDEMKKYMVHIESDKYYDSIYNLSQIYYLKVLTQWNIHKEDGWSRFKAVKYITDLFNNCHDISILESLDLKIKEYLKNIEKLDLRNWVFEHENYNIGILIIQGLIMLLLIPIFLFGFINNYLPFMIPQWMIRKVKDRQFHSSFKFVIASFLFPIFYIILFSLACIFIKSIWVCLLYLLLLPLTASFAYKYYVWVKKYLAKFRYNLLIYRKDKTIQKTLQLRNDIFEITMPILK